MSIYIHSVRSAQPMCPAHTMRSERTVKNSYLSVKCIVIVMNPLEDVEFLARSVNRVRALQLLSTAAYTRRELMAELGVSKATVNRILSGFEAQGWVTTVSADDRRRYRATPPGVLMSAAFDSVLGAAEQAHNLKVTLRWLPVEELPFDPARLADATVVLPCPGDPIAPVHRVIEWMRTARWVRLLPVGYVAESLRVNRNAVVEGGQSFEAVFKTEILDCIAADPTAAGYLADVLEAGGRVYHYDGSIPYGVLESDHGYGIGLVDDSGAAQALVETDDEVVGDWLRSVLETYRDTSERLDSSSWTNRCARRSSA